MRFDLLIQGGHLIDPGTGRNGRFDVAIARGHVVAVDETIPAAESVRVIDATDLLVTPGLIDLHTHVFRGVGYFGIDADTVAARSGVTIPDGATAQYLYIRDHGDTMTVQQALHTPGALLFHFGHEPKDLGDIPADGHVAISLGDGVHTIEARGHAYGTNVFDNAGGRSFNFAGMIPGMT